MQRISRECIATLILFAAAVSAADGQAADYDWDNIIEPGKPFESGAFLQGQIIVYFEPGSIPQLDISKDGGIRTDQIALDRLNARFGVHKLERVFPALPAHSKKPDPIERQLPYLVEYDTERSSLRETAEGYLALPNVSRVQPVALLEVDAEVPDDPMLSAQTWLRSPSPGGKDVRAVGGWYHQKGDPNIIICIADSGVDWQHPDLGGTGPDFTDGVIWTNWDEVNGTPGVDDDGNGKVDDIRGWDFVHLTPELGPPSLQTPPQDVSDEDADPMDYDGHGTSCAGCASAITGNGIGVAGTSWGCSIMPARIGYTDVNGVGRIVTLWAARAMDYARLSGARVFNASWGGGGLNPTGGIDTAADLAVAAGMVIVKSAGNLNTNEADYLSSRDDILSVAALNAGDQKASFSTYGSWVDISAPGVNIWTLGYNASLSGAAKHVYSAFSGTSASAPIVAGAVGLYLSANPAASREETWAAVTAAVDEVDSINPLYAGELGTGRINLAKLFDNPMWLMPDQFDDLTDAFNAAGQGDSIAIAGTMVFTDKFIFPNKPVSILGGWSDDFSTRDPVGNRSTIAVTGAQSAVVALASMGPDTILDGFDISGGSAGQSTLPSLTSGRFGGGILFLNGASPTISNCRVHGNEANLIDGYAGGGGIAIIESSPTFVSVEVDANTSLDGSAIFVYGGSPSFTDMNIHDNISYPTGPNPPQGGAIYVHGSGMAKKLDDVSIDGGTISGHDVDGHGGAIYAEAANLSVSNMLIDDNQAGSSGGAIYITGGSYTGNNNIVSNNAIDASSGGTGGGLYVTGASVSITGSDYVANSADFAAGGMHIDNAASPIVTQTLIAESSATTLATAMYLTACTNATISQSTIANNTGAFAGGNGIYLGSGAAAFSNNIFAFNGGGGTSLGDGVACLGGASATFSCNLAFGNTAANYTGCPDPTGSDGNVALDPLFCDTVAGDYRIGTGSAAAAAQSGCGDMGSEDVGCDGTSVENNPSSYRLVLSQNFPNPFNPSTTIQFTLPVAGRARIDIFDLRGRLVRRLLDEVLEPGPHTRAWNGRNDDGRRVASATYFYELRVGEHRAVGKMGLVK
jgi:hypothetical protein